MGIACCVDMGSHNLENSSLYQINRYAKCDSKKDQILPESNRESHISISSKNNPLKNSFNKKQYLKNKKGEFLIFGYDAVDEYYQEIKVTLPIIKTIEGMSELNMDRNLFLCGISPKQKNEGSFLLKINIDKYNSGENDQLKAEVLINSQHTHIYPSLIHDKKEKILCIGGKGQTKCEVYNLTYNKWFTLPELQEERYKCTLCLDYLGNFVYLFGGVSTDPELKNNENKDNSQINVLRMDLENQLIWENLIVKTTQRYLNINRTSSGAFTFQYDENFIFIVGGEDSNENCLDDVIRFSIKKLTFESTNMKLKNRAKFMNQNGVSIDEQSHCLIDCFNNIHIIERHDCLPIDYHMDEI